MLKTVIINESQESTMQERLHKEIKKLKKFKILDIKMTGAYTSSDERYIVIIIYKD